jgi:lipopolysaccharide export LptBFGC system permease protein LptF
LNLAGNVELIEIDKFRSQRKTTWQSQTATLELNGIMKDSKFELLLEDATWSSDDGMKGAAPTARKVFKNIGIPEVITLKLQGATIAPGSQYSPLRALIESIGTEDSVLKGDASQKLIAMQKAMQKKIWVTQKKIISETHSRLVFGLGCIALILIAIALGIIFRGGHLLSAFGASAIPAGILIIFLMSGKELAKTQNRDMPNETGILVMWSGLVLLSVLAGWIYRKLTRI